MVWLTPTKNRGASGEKASNPLEHLEHLQEEKIDAMLAA